MNASFCLIERQGDFCDWKAGCHIQGSSSFNVAEILTDTTGSVYQFIPVQ
jgi:hypothetical protein